MSPEILAINVVTSLLSGISGIFAGWVIIPFMRYYQDYIMSRYGQKIRNAVIKKGFVAAYTSIVIGAYFLYHTFYILFNSNDFNPEDWIALHALIGINMFLCVHFLLSLFSERRRIERIQDTKKG